MPKVSVIIPVYNVEKYLRQSLDSVINQTLRDIEIICVDDGSTDNSYAILQEYASKDDRFVLLKQETNQGTGAARNRAVNVAKGDCIMFLDPDDWLELDACEVAYNKINSQNTDIAIFPHNRFDEETGECKTVLNRVKPFINADGSKIILDNLKNNFIVTAYLWGLIYKRDFVLAHNIKCSKNRIYEDQPFFMSAMIWAKDISYIEKPLYNYRVRAGSSTFISEKKYKELYNVKKIIFEEIKKCPQISRNKLNALYTHTVKSALFWYNKNENENIIKDFYNYVHKILKMIDKNYLRTVALKRLKLEKFTQFETMRSYNYTQYQIIQFLQEKNILNISYIDKYKRKQLSFCGIKIKHKL